MNPNESAPASPTSRPTPLEPSLDALSDEAAVERLYELAARGVSDSPEFEHLDALVYARLVATYERGAGTAGIIHLGGNRAA